MARSKKRSRSAIAAEPPESSRSIAATVGWMLATLTTLVGIVAVTGLLIAARSITPNQSLVMLSRLLLFAAAISGLTSLVLLAVTWKVRQIRPPMAIVVFSIIIALTPLVGVVVAIVRS
ncbi:MAG: hypothetical protein K8T91_16830 [Planctomycetes bacterium]|nr:hypothetical protein [Planctomycetota bacterium]